jgi:hypothetical protein
MLCQIAKSGKLRENLPFTGLDLAIQASQTGLLNSFLGPGRKIESSAEALRVSHHPIHLSLRNKTLRQDA